MNELSDPGSKMLQIPARLLPALGRTASSELSAIDAVQALRDVGLEAGSALFTEFEGHLNGDNGLEEIGPDEFWNRLGEFFEQAGWGRMEYQQLNGGVGLLSSMDWAEATPDGAAQPTCHITTGILSELLSRTADSDVAILEVECRSRGDERCGFAVGSSDTLGSIYERLREGTTFSDAVGALG